MARTFSLPPRKLTKRAIHAIEPPPEGAAIVRDTELRGLGVRVTAAGNVMFIYERKVKGRSRRWSLGRFGDITVVQARRKALELANEIAHGEDPDAKKRAAEVAARTLREAVAEYLETRPLKPRTKRDVTVVLNRYLSDWMDRELSAIRAQDVVDRYREVCERSPAQANLCMRYLRAVFGFARAAWRTPDGTPVIAENPVRVLSDLRAWRRLQPRRTVIEPHELKPWFEAVLADPDPRARDFFVFVILTGARRGEALGLTWDRVNLEAGKVLFTETKAHRDHELPVGPYLLGLLERRREAAGDPWVFANRKSGARLDNLRFSLGRIRRASGVRFTVHDLRRTFATVAESLDVSGYTLKALLNHALPQEDVTAGYLRLTPERLRDAMTKIERKILNLGGVRPGARVIPMPRAGATMEARHER